MKKLLLFSSLSSQILMGAEQEQRNIALEALDFTTGQYHELEDFQNDDRAYQIILQTAGKSPADLARDGYTYLAKITQKFNKGNLSQEEVFHITEFLIQKIDDLIIAIDRIKKVEQEVSFAAKEIEVLYELAKSKHAASVIEVKEGMSVTKIADRSFAELAKNADWYEKGLVSDRMVSNTVRCLLANTHRIVNSIKDDAPYLFEKGKYGRRKSI